MTTTFAVKMQTCGSVAILLAIIFTGANAYSKFGRKCADIGCLSHQVCEMKEQPCTSSSSECGLYPSCVNRGGAETCQSKLCPSGQYCKTEGGVPTCVDTKSGLAPAARKPPGWERPRVTPRPAPPTPPAWQRPQVTSRPVPPTTPAWQRPQVTYRPAVPTPPPRSSSFDDRYRGHSGGSNTIGSGSIWDRLFGGGGSKPKTDSTGSRGSGFFDRPTSKPSGSNYYPGGKDKYNTHVSTDSKGNRQWTFSG